MVSGALALGASHAFEADHLAAVSAFVSTRPTARRAARFGLGWAAGHAVSLMLFGSVLYGLKLALPEAAVAWFERAAGAGLLVVGIWALAQLRKGAGDVPHRHGKGPVWLGMLHGLAGTAAFVAQAAVAASGSFAHVALFTVVFSAGLLAAMAAYSVALGALLGTVAGRTVAALRGALAMGACLTGVSWMIG
jgi:hypothetical protein